MGVLQNVEDNQAPRLDKWLWAVRLYKTRSLAIAACQAGHVKIEDQRVKPSRPVRLGEIIEARTGDLLRRYRVLALLDRRVGAKLVPQYAEDLTLPGESTAPREPRLEPLFHRPKGAGRPTKRDRRLLDQVDV
ncbi:MAG: RNA-binding S4 domain-containing protein [Verrucomicrobiales bacterium]|nr:RNA-binding S4 domain-containing protein [Verrucomicrobiales bacterium]